MQKRFLLFENKNVKTSPLQKKNPYPATHRYRQNVKKRAKKTFVKQIRKKLIESNKLSVDCRESFSAFRCFRNLLLFKQPAQRKETFCTEQSSIWGRYHDAKCDDTAKDAKKCDSCGADFTVKQVFSCKKRALSL